MNNQNFHVENGRYFGCYMGLMKKSSVKAFFAEKARILPFSFNLELESMIFSQIFLFFILFKLPYFDKINLKILY